MKNHFLYSTNPDIKFFIQKEFYNNEHFVWCSDQFDSTVSGQNHFGKYTPPSSNPADIYRELEKAIRKNDKHCPKIYELRAKIISLASKHHQNGIIEKEVMEEICYHVEEGTLDIWKPYIYIIPRDLVKEKMELVPPQNRAGAGYEYIIKNLKEDEFDRIRI